jgi:hypothetical protein
MNPNQALARHDQDTLVRLRMGNDRELLIALGMSDSDAASFLGRSRQALHQMLGPKDGSGAPSNYFKAGDILTLVSAARQLGRVGPDFDPDVVLDYAEATRKESEPEAFALLRSVLSEKPQQLDLEGADAVILVLAGFAEMLSRFPSAGEFLTELVRKAASAEVGAEVVVVCPTSTRARIAGEWLRVPASRCFGNDLADHYLPTIVILRAGEPGVFVLTENGNFNGSAPFARATMAESVWALLPAEARQEIEERRARGARRS